MKLYIFYILTSVLTAWMILFLFGISADFANYTPIMALLGSVLLFTIAAPILIYNARIGLVIGIIGCILMLPYSLGSLKDLFEDGVFNWGTLLAVLPTILLLIGTYLTVRGLFKNIFITGVPVNNVVKMLLAGAPVLLFIIYLISIWRYLSWDMFKV